MFITFSDTLFSNNQIIQTVIDQIDQRLCEDKIAVYKAFLKERGITEPKPLYKGEDE